MKWNSKACGWKHVLFNWLQHAFFIFPLWVYSYLHRRAYFPLIFFQCEMLLPESIQIPYSVIKGSFLLKCHIWLTFFFCINLPWEQSSFSKGLMGKFAQERFSFCLWSPKLTISSESVLNREFKGRISFLSPPSPNNAFISRMGCLRKRQKPNFMNGTYTWLPDHFLIV